MATFTEKLKRLEVIVAELEKPELELEQGLTLLEEGVALHKECQDLLNHTQIKITKLLEAQAEPAQAAKPEPKPRVEETTLFESDDEGLPF